MELIRHGNDINVTWSIFGRNESPYSINGKVYGLWLINGSGKKQITSFSVQARNQLVFLIDNLDLNRLGSFKLELQLREPGAQGATYDLTQVFQIVSETYPRPTATSINGVCDIAFRSVLKNVYVSELEGASAYDIAVQQGYTGSKAEWLQSLVGIKAVSQITSSVDSGGRNTIRFVLADGSVSDINIFNGSRGASGVTSLRDLSDVSLSEPLSYGDLLRYNGTQWTNVGGLDYTYGNGIKISEERVISADIPEIAAGLIAAGYSLSPGGEGASALNDLSDVTLSSPSEGQVLTYDAILGKWVARNPTGGSGGGSSTLGGLTDVYLPTQISENQVLGYSLDADGQGNGGWVPITLSGGTPLTDYVTLTTAQTISGAKTFSSALTASSSLSVGTTIKSGGAITVGNGTSDGSTRRIYFGDTSHYLELNSSGYHFYGGGVYSDSFVSAGGLGSGSGGGGSLPDGASLNQFLVYRRVNGANVWTPDYLSLADFNYISSDEQDVFIKGENGWSARPLLLEDISDVDVSNPTANYYLKYVVPEGQTTGTWKPMPVSGSDSQSNNYLFYGSPFKSGCIRLSNGNSTNYYVLTDANCFSNKDTTNKTVDLTIQGETCTLCLKDYSSGGGTNVSILQIQDTGTRIAQIQIGSSSPFYLYAPTGGSSGTIPTHLPNPNSLQFGTGSSATQYDGSDTVIVSASDITRSLGYTPLQSSAISDMATKTWVNQQGFVKTSDLTTALADYATEDELDDYLKLTGGTMTGTINSRSIIPTGQNYNLGSSSYYWANAYVSKIRLGDTGSGNTPVPIYLDENGRVVIQGNLVVTGFVSAGGINDEE